MRRARSRSGPGTGPRQDPEHEMAASKRWAAASGRGRRVSRSPRTGDWRGSGDPATNTTRKYAARQCRQTVPPGSYSPESSISWKFSVRNLPNRAAHRWGERRGRIKGADRGDASRGRIEGAHRGVRSRFPGRLLLRHHTVPVRAGHRHVTSDHEAASRPASRPVRERDRSSRPVPWLAPRRAIEPHAPPFSCQGHRATCTAVRHGRRHRVVWVGNVHEPLPGHTSTAPCPSIRSVAEHPTRVRTSSPWPSTRPISEHPARIRTSGPGPPRPLLQEEPHR